MITRKMKKSDSEMSRTFLPGSKAAIIVPVKSGGSSFGVLGFGFQYSHQVSADNVRLCNAVAEIAAASLRRSVILKSLERQVDLRTQHLATLYEINAIVGEPSELDLLMHRILQITVNSMSSRVGFIHFLDEKRSEFKLRVQSEMDPEISRDIEILPAKGGFFERLAKSSNPVVVSDLQSDPSIPREFSYFQRENLNAFIGAPIRSKGKTLGLLSLFDRSILDYSIEDITLFMTIADQLGGLVERTKLMKQAEIAAVVQERQRLARELHDSVTQLLYSQVLFAGASSKVLAKGDLVTTNAYLDRIDKAAQQALKEMRLLVYQLRPSDYLEEGLIGALSRRLESVEKRTNINASLVFEGEINLDESQEMALYRIAEEALNNTLKHAQASEVIIKVSGTDNGLSLSIRDNGLGFDPEVESIKGGMGLENMTDRALALGGKFRIEIKTRIWYRNNCRNWSIEMNRFIQILIVDDHTVVRDGLNALLSAEPGMKVVGMCGDGQQAVKMTSELHPDVILLDLVMPKMDGVQATLEIKKVYPQARILILTSFAENHQVFSAIKAGAIGYLMKDTSSEELIQAIRDTYEYRPALGPNIAHKLMMDIQNQEGSVGNDASLTEREVEILQHMALGQTNQDIADELFLSERTVRTHVTNILAKLGLNNRTQAVLYALREGIAHIDYTNDE